MRIGIIGGSGLENPDIIKDSKKIEVNTIYGNPSSPITLGTIQDIDVCIISRHGQKHEFPPSQVNYRANIQALKDLGCKYIIATTACGSLREEIKRGDIIILDDFIDFTNLRKNTFFEHFDADARHTPMANPFSQYLRDKLIISCNQLNIPHHKNGTVITIEGPRFSTISESKMYRVLGADVVNMSIATEAALAREAGIEYAVIAMSTDYDCWKQDEEPVSWRGILEIFNKNIEKVKALLLQTLKSISNEINIKAERIKQKVRTVPNWPKPGIMFRDITTLISDKEGFRDVVEILEERYKNREIDVIAGIESRGFIIGSALATKLNKGLILIRKPGKLPAEKIREEYSLEYGKDAVEIHRDAVKPFQKVLLIDDLLATGGTCLAAGNLIEKLGGQVVECAFVINLPELKGHEKLRWPVFSIIDFEGD
jgi:5'-methylthioadenosine phosphorylase